METKSQGYSGAAEGQQWPVTLRELAAMELEPRKRLIVWMQDQATALRGIHQLIRDTDTLATKETDSDGVITGYRFNTGAWHRLLGVVNGAELPAYIRQQITAHPEGQPHD